MKSKEMAMQVKEAIIRVRKQNKSIGGIDNCVTEWPNQPFDVFFLKNR